MGKNHKIMVAKDACICLPIRVVGGLKNQDLQPLPLMTQTPNPEQILTILRYTLAKSGIKIQLKEMGENDKTMVARLRVYVYP